jgi:hypothetical protein
VKSGTTDPRGSLLPRRPRGSLLPRRTSEHWYDDELEYDAVREILDPKRVVIASVDNDGATAASLPKLRYAVGFCSEQASEAASEVWSEELGRAGPPLFLKVRKRLALTELDEEGDGASASAASAEAFWAEVSAQNWRTELDYGLGSGEDETSSPLAVREEAVLVLVNRQEAARALAAHAVAGADGGSLFEIALLGWNQDPDPEKHEPLGEWRECLRPRRL